MSDYSQTRIYAPAAPRTAPLTATMRSALDTIRANGSLSSGNGFSRATVRALADAGEVVLTLTQEWGTTYPGHRAYSFVGWIAHPTRAAEGAPLAAVRISQGSHGTCSLTVLHLDCDCELGDTLHAAFTPERFADAITEANRIGTGTSRIMHLCDNAHRRPAAPRPAVEDVLDGIAAACLTLQGSGRPVVQPQPEQPGETVLLDRNGAELTLNAPVFLHGPNAHPGAMVAGWNRTTGAVLVSVRGGGIVHVGDSAEIEIAPRIIAPPAPESRPVNRGAQLVEALLAVFPADLIDRGAQQQLMTDTVCDLFHTATPEQPEYEALRAGFRAVAGWSKHIAGGRASVRVCSHVNALTGRAFAELLGRMVNDEVTNTGQAEDWFANLGRELLEDATHH